MKPWINRISKFFSDAQRNGILVDANLLLVLMKVGVDVKVELSFFSLDVDLDVGEIRFRSGPGLKSFLG